MIKWAVIPSFLGLAVGSLGAMGVGARSFAILLLALALLAVVSFLIAWPFLKKRTRL